ncbi:MAG: YidC/Oxa1 family membrane protein insertase, partial [Gemmataceae bacterium]
IVYRNLGFDPELGQAPKLALDVRVGKEAEATHAMWEDDITVRVNTRPIDLEPGKSVTHRYLLYNGPVKPSLLKHLGGDRKVDPALLSLYVDKLHLNTMTDYQSPGWFGHVWYRTGVTWLVISITNVIHFVLGHLYYWIPNLGLCVIVLTVMVRGVMYPLSRKQAMMGLKMQALAPEMKKLQQKYGEDKQGLQLAQWDLFKKHGVNPLGSCWVLLLQMPIFMGLWYALQESIVFRLAPFWPTWVVNLAAPDMLFGWGRGWPVISSDASYGGFLYLGPYLNILPIIAVVLMAIQQQMMTPPPADEQQEMQQKMMKYMMVFFGLMFYKVAAGLCLYYIATTLWGFAERAMLPKATLAPVNVDLAAASSSAPSDGVTATGPGGITGGGKKNRKKRKEAKEAAAEAAEPTTGFGKWQQGWAEWWKDVLDQAKKK